MPAALRRRTRAVLAATTAAVLLAAVAGWWWSRPGAPLAVAVRLAPADTQRISWVHWEGVRREVGATRATSGRGLRRLLDRGFDADLTSTSALLSSAEAMRASLGLSPGNLVWEQFSQGTDGAVVLMATPEGLDFDALADRLRSLGYRRPGGDGGTWRGGADVAVRAGFTPELQHLALLEDRDLVVASDRAGYVATAVATAAGDRAAVEGLDEVAGAAGEALSASVYTGAHACEQLAMAQADPADATQGEQLVEAAGGVGPVTAFAVAAHPQRRLSVLFSYESEDRARDDADARARLAAGPAPGQGGDFTERFRLEQAVAEGTLLRLDVTARAGQFVMADLTTGPVLLASC